ncbi:hypothetical protein BHE74_00036392 [Ensete ventricosum]|nr:hypothetical protein BHE74_00036392 [Ensete ventricosum]
MWGSRSTGQWHADAAPTSSRNLLRRESPPLTCTPKAEDRVAGFRLRWNDGAGRAVDADHEVMGWEEHNASESLAEAKPQTHRAIKSKAAAVGLTHQP